MPLRADKTRFTDRHRAMLRAVDSGRAEALCGRVPDLLIDGRFCDFVATGELFRAGLISARPGPRGHRVAVRVTDAGRSVLADVLHSIPITASFDGPPVLARATL
jgi:hypothetical protein